MKAIDKLPIIIFLMLIVAVGFGCSKQYLFMSSPAHCWTGKEMIVWDGSKIFKAFNPERNCWRNLENNPNIKERAYDQHIAFVGNEKILAVYWKTETHEFLCFDYYNLKTDKWKRYGTIDIRLIDIDWNITSSYGCAGPNYYVEEYIKNKTNEDFEKFTLINGISILNNLSIVSISRFGYSKTVFFKVNTGNHQISAHHMDNWSVGTANPVLHTYQNQFLCIGSRSVKKPRKMSWNVWNGESGSWEKSSQLSDFVYDYGHTSAGESIYIYGGSVRCGTGETWNMGFVYSFSNSSIKKLPKGNIRKRRNCAMCWTGKEILVWGGFDIPENNGMLLIDDAIVNSYNPDEMKWNSILASDSPSPRFDPICYWTGKEMMIWGGYKLVKDYTWQIGEFDGYAYDPKKRQWRRLTQLSEL